ncbi:hypothetical protein [Salipiger sp.]|uniref:hypothetical protein n=1 Tax=Salipiger sp. TaxID=2078585 RepID=UPI003A96B6E2
MSDAAVMCGRVKARDLVGRLNRLVMATAAERRQGIGSGNGARGLPGLGAGRVELHSLTKWTPDGDAPVTALGYKTAVRALPPALSALDAKDPRRLAAAYIADAFERVDSIKGMDLGGGDIKGGLSDGGATSRVKHAERLRVIERKANGWALDRRTWRARRGAERVVLPVVRRRGDADTRKEITAMGLLRAVCVEGMDMRQILAAYGWSTHGKHRKELLAALLELLDQIAGPMHAGPRGA